MQALGADFQGLTCSGLQKRRAALCLQEFCVYRMNAEIFRGKEVSCLQLTLKLCVCLSVYVCV